jgi:hypothetical protein
VLRFFTSANSLTHGDNIADPEILALVSPHAGQEFLTAFSPFASIRTGKMNIALLN